MKPISPAPAHSPAPVPVQKNATLSSPVDPAVLANINKALQQQRAKQTSPPPAIQESSPIVNHIADSSLTSSVTKNAPSPTNSPSPTSQRRSSITTVIKRIVQTPSPASQTKS